MPSTKINPPDFPPNFVSSPRTLSADADVQISPVLLSAFLRYIQWSLKRHFHRVHLATGGEPSQFAPEHPLIVYLNHASWWDPLLMLWLGARLYPGRRQYGPMDAAQLERYSFFKRLGVFGVRQGGSMSARSFLRHSESLLSQKGAMLWLTPQGRFADIRERPVRFAPGLAHLATRLPHAVFIPLAFEYTFGQERHPEIFIRFGSPQTGNELGADVLSARATLERSMETNQDALKDAVCFRTPDSFTTLLTGRGGASVPYDLWRKFKASISRTSVNLNHGNL